jgi:cytochrome c-type biogenesis protein CcmH
VIRPHSGQRLGSKILSALASPLSSPAAPRQRLGSKILLVALAVSAAVAGPAIAAAPAAVPVDERVVHELAAQLRCVVCQTLSVADSPSETANQMRQIIRERLAAGETPEQVRQYFVQRYGEWILLAPPKEGFNLLVWVVPFVGLGAGLVLVVIVLRRWSRKPAAGPSTPVDPAMRERIRREMSGGGNP